MNGLGLSVASVERRVSRFESSFSVLPDNTEVAKQWRRLVVAHSVKGVQVHDARLAATMKAYDVPQILTFNTKDFARFPHVQAVHPQEV